LSNFGLIDERIGVTKVIILGNVQLFVIKIAFVYQVSQSQAVGLTSG
jgi:hypothetical protein